MALSYSSHARINQSTLTDVSRDQNFHIQTGPISIVHTHISLFGSRQTFLHVLDTGRDAPTWPTSIPKTPSRHRALVPTCNLPPKAVGIATSLILEIINLLIEHANQSPVERRELMLELKALYEVLVLTDTAIQEYENRPLGHSLVNVVTHEVIRCSVVLEDVLERVSGTREGLDRTKIGGLWPSVWWRRWNGDELSWLRKKLFHSQQLLGGFLIALNSYVLFEFSALPTLKYRNPRRIEVLGGWRSKTNSAQVPYH